MNKNVNNQDIYTVENCSVLTSYDRKILSALYQPIIGIEAVTLYTTLWSEEHLNQARPQANRLLRICKLMRLPINKLVHQFDLLEAIGLIKVYYQKNNDFDAYHFKIYSPPKADDFFKNPLLVSMLLDVLEDDDFHRTKMQFVVNKFDLSKYQEITKKYTEVFTNVLIERIDHQDDYAKYEYASISSDFDFKLLEDLIRNNQLSPYILNKEVRNKIEMSILAYDLSSVEIMDMVIDCVKEDNFIKYIDLSEFDELCRIKTQVKKYKDPFERIHLKDSNATTIYEKYSVVEFLNKYYSNLKVTPEILSELENCMKKYNTINGVMNVILEYVVKKNNYIKLSYLKSIVADWSSKNIDSVNKGLEIVNKIETNYQNNINKNVNNSQNNYSRYAKVIGSDSYWQDKINQEPEVNSDDDYLEQIKLKFQTKGGE